MRTHHTQHSLPAFPVYSAAFVGEHKLVLGGGGGSARSGIKNRLRLFHIPNDEKLELLSELELEKDEDAPMSMIADAEGSRIVCGINSATEELDKGINQNCRVFSIAKDRFELAGVASTLHVTRDNMEECQKVTALSPGRTLVAAAGTKDLAVLSYPSLTPAAKPLKTKHEIYDASFSPTSLVVATTDELLVYALPSAAAPPSSPPGTKTRSKQKQKQKAQKGKAESVKELKLLETVERPALPGLNGVTTTFRAVRFHPSRNNVVFTVQNTSNTGVRKRGSRMPPKQGFVCRWNTDNWKIVRSRKVSEKGITCFDVSPDGRFLAYGSADYAIGILDSTTLAVRHFIPPHPLLTVLRAHEFPPTVLRFNPTSTLLVSGSADNSIRAVAIPEGLAGTKWTVVQVLLITLLVLSVSILISYAISSGKLKF
ncbi:WD40 repeat-like protein [Fomitiporia mediterranea MF3/22]|uniref:WD40 repeat-like protein n=1 Tax=Fomitiporia mediterranea (strain MF3/22) TaxID=694068 RepID=UPI0004409C84|nr:WD40 repeat-like protein [Fomitiporia mediterranea MF3/22]EJD01209.1 WD40 repeat-like protein [Fomitiporia mediterranea MF3/22]